MKRFILSMVVCALFFTVNAAAKSAKELSVELNLDPSSKATRQWERVFKKRSKWGKYGIDNLSDSERDELKKYLIDHAADSDRPAAAGM